MKYFIYQKLCIVTNPLCVLQAQCIVDQYSSYRLENIDLAINGKMTQGENIADNGGLKQVCTSVRVPCSLRCSDFTILHVLKLSLLRAVSAL